MIVPDEIWDRARSRTSDFLLPSNHLSQRADAGLDQFDSDRGVGKPSEIPRWIGRHEKGAAALDKHASLSSLQRDGRHVGALRSFYPKGRAADGLNKFPAWNVPA